MLPPFQKLHKQERATLTILHCLWGGPVWRGHSCPRMRKEGSKSLQRKRFETAFTPGGQECPPHTEPDLLDFDHRASVRKLLLDGLGFLFGNALFYRLGRSVDQLLGFFQAQAGDFADSLDHIDLVGADFLEHDGEFRLLFRRSRRCRSTAAARHHDRGRRRCRHAKTRFEFLDQFRRLEQRQPYYRFFNLCQIRHVHFSSYLVFSYFRHPQTRSRCLAPDNAWNRPRNPRFANNQTFVLCRAGTLARLRTAAQNPAGKSARSTQISPQSLCFFELLLLHTLVDDHRQIASNRIHHGRQTLGRSVDQEQQLRIELFFRRHGGQRFDLLDRNDLAFDYADLESKFRRVLGVLGQSLGHRDGVASGIGNRSHADQILQRAFYLGALGSLFGERVFHDLLLRARAAQCLAQFIVLGNSHLGISRHHGVRHVRQILAELLYLFRLLRLANRHNSIPSMSCFVQCGDSRPRLSAQPS